MGVPIGHPFFIGMHMDSAGKNPTNKDLYFLLGEIDAKLDGVIQMQGKVIYALIALAGATVGLKLMGSPPLAVIARYINLFVFLFAVLLAIGKRRMFYSWQHILLFGIFGICGNLYYLIFNNHEWIRTGIFIIANSNLVLFLWNWDKWRK